MNFTFTTRSCLPGTLVTARAVASLKEADGNQLLGAPFTQCTSCRKKTKGVKGVLPSEVKGPKARLGFFLGTGSLPSPDREGDRGALPASPAGSGAEPRPLNDFPVI